MRRWVVFAAAAAILAACAPRPAALRVTEARIVAPLGGQTETAAYLSIVNNGPADRLTAVSSPIAAAVEIHRTEAAGPMIAMRRLDALDVPAKATVTFAPGGLHLMVFLKAALKPGDRAALTLQFANAGAVTVTARVTAPGADRHPMH